jgi:hypothetical protein
MPTHGRLLPTTRCQVLYERLFCNFNFKDKIHYSIQVTHLEVVRPLMIYQM